jgi:hypothetical protein
MLTIVAWNQWSVKYIITRNRTSTKGRSGQGVAADTLTVTPGRLIRDNLSLFAL